MGSPWKAPLERLEDVVINSEIKSNETNIKLEHCYDTIKSQN